MTVVLFFACLIYIIMLLALFILAIVVAYFMINSKFMKNAPPVPTSGKIKKIMIEDVCKLLSNHKNQVVMDLGSGWGSLLLPLAKKFSQHHFIGIEYAYIPYFISKFRSRKMENIKFYRENFFDSDISKANIIFLFLLNHMMPQIAKKCLTEAQENTLIYVNRFPIPNLKPIKKTSIDSEFYTYYVYKI